MKTTIKLPFEVKIFKESKVTIIYSKKYDISGYGNTLNEAIESFEIAFKTILGLTKPKKK